MPDDQELLDLAASLRDDVQPTKADQVRGQLKAAETYNPDAYAKAMKAGAKKGVRPQVVMQDPKAFEDRPNAEELVVLSPKTADWILEHFDNAVVGGDDVKNLSRLEDLPRLVAAPPPTFTDRVRGLFRSAMEGTLFASEAEAQAIRQAESARQQTERRFGLKPGEFHTGAVTALPTARIAAGFARGAISPMAGLASFAERKTGIDLGLGRVGKSLVGALTPQAPTLADVATENVASTLGLLIPSMGVSKAVQLTTKIPALAKYPRAAKMLGDWAGPVAMALPEAAAEAESAYDQNIAQGMEPAQASRRADAVFASNLVLLAATDKITWFGKGPQWRKSLSEAIQEGGQQVSSNIATGRPVMEGTGEAAGAGAAIATAIPVLGKFLNQIVSTRGMRYATPLEMAQKEIIQNLADTAKDSKLLQRSPEDFAKAAQAIAPVENLRIQPDAFVTYFQSKNIDPVKMAETLGIQNFEEASVSGTDLLIPTGAYAAHLAASEHHAELSQDMRLGEDMLTPREAAAAEATKGQVEELGQAVSLEVDEATQARTEFQAIQEDLKGRYIQAGETPAVADTYALDMAKVFYTLAQREGLKPQELMAQYAPKIVRGQAPMPEQVVAEAFTPETFPEEGVQWWEKDDLWFQGAYGEKPQKVETAPGVVQAPFRQTEFQGQLEDYQKTGQWYYNERRMVPLAAIEEKAPWDEGRRVDAETRLKDTAATTPVLLATEDGGKTFKIQDGIHRIAAAKAQGFTAIPAEVQVVVSDRAPVEGDFAGKDQLAIEPQFKGVDVESPEFKAWFGDSKVVDENGKPLKVYHGTSAEFEQFNLDYFGLNDKGYLGDGFYFGSQTVASAYGTKGDAGRVIPAYLSLKKPFEITPENWKEQLGRIRALKEDGKSVREELTKDGFDGVIDRSSGKISEIVAFDPTQIKSATSNTGAFSRTDPRILYQTAFHGTPYRGIEKFSLAKIGTGEGAQAYGWGLYFAGKKEIAEYYRKELSVDEEKFNTKIDGEIPPYIVEAIRKANARGGLAKGLEELNDQIKYIESTIERYEKELETAHSIQLEGLINYWRQAIKSLRQVEDSRNLSTEAGQLYEVEIPENNEYLLWDKPLSEQPEIAAKAITQAKDMLEPVLDNYLERLNADWDELTGMDLYYFLKRASKDDALVPNGPNVQEAMERGDDAMAASMWLLNENVRGNQYLDATSRTKGKGSYNYVIFDENAVKIQKTYYQSQKDDFSFGSKAWNEYYRSQVGSRARAKGDQAARAKKALEAAGTKRGHAEFDAEREAALGAEEEAFLRFDRAVEQIAKPRGWFTRAADGTFIIGKTPQGDFSTFIHEPAHAYLEMFKDLATREGASERIQDDGAKVLAFLGVESWEQIGTIEHEKWARANEAYCREGKAPSDTLRGVFERFRVWLTMVYRQVTALDVELNDDIRGVFDRMRATDEEIELAHADIAGPRLFRTAEEAGMTEKDFQRYAREKDLEVEQAKGEILAKLNAAAVREKTKEWKEEAANVRAAIEQWVDAQPNFRAVAVLRAGKLEDGTAFTLKKDALVEQFGEERTGALHKAHPGIYRVEGELDAETAAEILGFESGEALIQAIEETPKRGEVIKSEVQRVMTERHGDIRYDGTLEDQAMQAIANDQRAKGLHKELEALKRKLENAPAQTKIQSLKDQIAKLEEEAKAQVKEKDEDAAFLAKQANALAETNEQLRARLEARDAKIQALKDQLAQAEAERKQETREDRAQRRAVRELPPIQSFRDEAKRLVDGKAIKDLQPQTYLNAMRTYGRKAWVSDKKQDYQGAYDAKLKEILNQFLYLEAKKTLAESEKAFKYVKDLQKPSNVQAIAKAGGEEGQHVYWDQIQNILNEYQFIKVPNRNLRDTALFAAEHEQFGIAFDVTQLPGAKNYRELTLPQITAVVDALKNIEHVAKNLGKVYQKLKKVDLEIEVKEASDSAYASHTGKLKPIPSMGEYQTWIQKLPQTVATWRAKMGKLDWWVDYLDGGNINGAWRRNTFGMINPAAARKNQVGKLVHQKMRELYAAMPKNFRDNLWRDTGIKFPNRERPLNEGQLICWFLNLGTEENRLKATLGEGLMDGMGIMSPVYDQALAGLTLQQCQFVQGLWDTLGIMLPDIKAKHLRETGLELKLKKVTPFKVKTKDGKAFNFQGGYWPLKADPWLSQVGELQEMMGIPTLGTIARPTTNKSHTKAVTNATYALNLDIGANLTQHIDDVLTDTYCAEAMNDVFKFLRQPGIKKSIQQTMGAEYYQEFLSWLLDFSNSNKTVDQGDGFLLKPLLRFKSAFVVSKLALNFISNAMQLLDPIKVFLDKDMKVLSYAKGFTSVMLNRKLFAEVQELSPNVMRFRAENWNRELHELANYRGKFNSKLAAFQQAAMITFTLMDKLNTTTAWYGRYIQGLEETNGDADQAIALADRIVDRSFQAGAPQHMSRLMRTKGWTNLFTTFGGDISTWFGIMDNAIRTGDPKRMIVVLMGLFIEQILAQIIRNRMPTEDEDEIEWLLLQAGHSVFGKIPFIGDMVEIGMAKLEDRIPQFGNPVFDAGEKALMSPFRAYDAYTKQEDAEKASMEIVDALGTAVGVPYTAQGLKSWRYFKDVREGKRPEPESLGQTIYEANFPPKKEKQ